MKFIVHSRYDVTRISPPEKKWALISICEDGDFPKVKTNDYMVDRLNLKFHDIDVQDPNPRMVYTVFNKILAANVIDFYYNMKANGVEVIVIHCLMGMSRSAAVAAALDKIENGDDNVWFKTKRPNSRVYSFIMYEASDRGLLD